VTAVVGEGRQPDRDRQVERILARVAEVVVIIAPPQPLAKMAEPWSAVSA